MIREIDFHIIFGHVTEYVLDADYDTDLDGYSLVGEHLFVIDK